MTIFDHLEELRERIFVSVLAVGAAILGCFVYSKDLIMILEAPVRTQGVRFLQLAPGEFFFTTIKVDIQPLMHLSLTYKSSMHLELLIEKTFLKLEHRILIIWSYNQCLTLTCCSKIDYLMVKLSDLVTFSFDPTTETSTFILLRRVSFFTKFSFVIIYLLVS